MHNAERQVAELLEQHGFALKRAKRHQVWYSPVLNLQIVFPSTGSDHRGWRNALADLKRRIRGRISQ